MAPTRPLKRQKTNPDDQPPTAASVKPEQIPLPPDTPTRQPQPDPPKPAQDSPRLSWYQSWSRKAAPVTEVARASSNSLTNAASETASIFSDRTTPRRPSTRSASLSMTLGKSGSTRSLPVDATTSKVHATSESTSPSRKNSTQTGPTENNDRSKGEAQQSNAVASSSCSPEDAVESKPDSFAVNNITTSSREPRQSGWFGWIPKGEPTSEHSKETQRPKTETTTSADSASAVPRTNASARDGTQPEIGRAVVEADKKNTNAQTHLSTVSDARQKRTWLQMLGGDSTAKLATVQEQPHTDSQTEDASKQVKSQNLDVPKAKNTPAKSADQSQASSVETSPPPPLPGDGSKSAGWVFWSRDKKQRPTTPSTYGKAPPHEGEIAISDTPSQSKPKRASISLPEDARPDAKALNESPSKDGKKTDSIKSKEAPKTPSDSKNAKKADPKVTQKIESKNATAVAVEQPKATRPASPAPSKAAVDNLLLPMFHDTLHVHQSPSLLQQLSRLLYYTKEPELRHLSLVKDPPRIRSALVIGVHGYFPGPMVRTLLGQPTGTSIKFADMAAKSIRKWTNSRGYDCEVKTAALEGEGKIQERVELLWKLLLNWIDEIRRSDFVMVACHSQGVPVAIMLIAKLIQFGCISAARVGICAMAGVSMGPFAELKSRWISGSAGELFEFSDATSKVSTDYQNAMETVLKAGARLTFVGSIDDQLVSLESSIFAPLTHPHIYRAVLIDSRIHAPGFLSHLVGFVLKLRNLGVQDHGLIRELSSPLAGSLYTGEGHSRIYDDEGVYDLATAFALETTAQLGVDVTKRDIQSSSGNPYILPFAMRGILEEEFVRSELREEVNQLLHQFDEWKPNTKALKDVKFRLEGVRSKL
ncbi:uncharacterized protein HMPREF1541_09886 [Cyphellophora europaea CBS 101466]|uniref:YMC020W-like alpha/beta hydrolase domain-containing protein n=1 Tax=Cyphellophora europaea (strain CBS 101466) TaxID=1220924 RepID=W2S8Q3_CYPE1|nr:uncharacterized protein HMPREF1541_09886 [Cyphellophora europaea CBS 101466]ETN45010.1 hypothetical protein HMPREF1541_09886 [Cyphellophora europaea CBS 101466]